MEKLKNAAKLIVKQKKEWGEIFTGIEMKNKYEIMDENGVPLYLAGEEGNAFARIFLKNYRPFRLHVLDGGGKEEIKGERPFRFWFHEISAHSPSGEYLGKVRQRFSVLSKKFTVEDHGGLEIYQIHGPLFHPWTFRILENGSETGLICKKWSGLGKEMFTDADTFNISFPPGADAEKKAVLLAGLFLIDMLYFEQR